MRLKLKIKGVLQVKEQHEFHTLKLLMTFVIFILFMKVYVLTVFTVDGVSMDPTLSDGELIIVDRFGYNYQKVERYDVIVFKHKDGTYFVKRVIGLPGEHIALQEKSIYINQERLAENYLIEQGQPFTLEEVTGKKRLPSQSYFVLGDHRTHSLDSRNFGYIHRQQIVGKVFMRYFPTVKSINK